MTTETEQEMRVSAAPTFSTADGLSGYVDSLVEREHDYGTMVYAMSLAATAAFNYVADKLGVTGFQASLADLDIIRRTRRIDGPFAIIEGRDMLFPQYDMHRRIDELQAKWKEWAIEEAKKKLVTSSTRTAHPDVVNHWRKLAKGII